MSLPVFTHYLADAIWWELSEFFSKGQLGLISWCYCCVLFSVTAILMPWFISLFFFFFLFCGGNTGFGQPAWNWRWCSQKSQLPTRCKAAFADLKTYSHFSWGFYFLFFWKWFCLSLKAFVRFHKISSRLIAKEWKERLQFSLFIQILEQNGSKNAKQWKKSPVYQQKRVPVCKHNTNT